jgi:hypothetical protein
MAITPFVHFLDIPDKIHAIFATIVKPADKRRYHCGAGNHLRADLWLLLHGDSVPYCRDLTTLLR